MLYVKEVSLRVQGLIDQQLKRSFGRFELIALEFHVLNTFQELAPALFIEALLQPMLLEHVKYVALSRKVADQNALAVASRFRTHVLVGGRIFEDLRAVDAIF